MALFECLMRKKTKEPIVSSSPKLKDKEKREGLGENRAVSSELGFPVF